MARSLLSYYRNMLTGVEAVRLGNHSTSGQVVFHFLAVLSLVASTGASPATAPSASPGSELSVALITIGPGASIEERFGHNAILVEDAAHHTSIAYNFGVFEWTDDFIFRFLSGRMDYWAEAWPARAMIESYKKDRNRTIWIQPLDLTPAQRLAIRDDLQRSVQPAHRTYRYNYYFRNCSTKVRDAIDRAVGGQLNWQLAKPAGATYRDTTRGALRSSFIAYTAVNYTLGHPADRPLTQWEECYLPVKLMQRIAEIRISDESHRAPWPLAGPPQLYYCSTAFEDLPTKPFWLPYYLLAGIAVAAAMVFLARRAGRLARIGLLVLGEAWLALCAFASLFLLYLWCLSTHVAVQNNENILQLGPLSLPLIVLLPALIYRGRWAKPAIVWAAAIAALSAIGLLLKVLPMFRQVNYEIIALALPINLGLLASVLLVARGKKNAIT